jgi:hypothetical protein
MTWLPGAILLAVIGVAVIRTAWRGFPEENVHKVGDSSHGGGGAS